MDPALLPPPPQPGGSRAADSPAVVAEEMVLVAKIGATVAAATGVPVLKIVFWGVGAGTHNTESCTRTVPTQPSLKAVTDCNPARSPASSAYPETPDGPFCSYLSHSVKLLLWRPQRRVRGQCDPCGHVPGLGRSLNADRCRWWVLDRQSRPAEKTEKTI